MSQPIIEKQRRDFHWEVIISMGLMIATILGVTLPFQFSIRDDMREARRETREQIDATREQIDAIHQEMKDFHGRLERMDTEFKNHMMYEHYRAKQQ